MKKVFLFLTLLLSVLFITTPSAKAYTFRPIDNILSYEIWVNPNDDATLDLEYSIKWKVLDYDDDGNGVSWVKIGVPNKYVSNAKSLSNDISNIKYVNDSGSAVYRIDLRKEFMKGDVIDIHFKYHLTHIFYEAKGQFNSFIQYQFIPGWFDDINVNKLTVYWTSKNIRYADTSYYLSSDNEIIDGGSDANLLGDYLVWTKSNLAQGERMSCGIEYEMDAFPNINLKEGYSNKVGFNKDRFIFFLVVLFFVMLIVAGALSSRYKQRSDYYSCRGFYPVDQLFYFGREMLFGMSSSGSQHKKANPTIPVSGGSGHSSGGHSCACACACACAGGGRAGCSKKDFYNTKVKFNDEKE